MRRFLSFSSLQDASFVVSQVLLVPFVEPQSSPFCHSKSTHFSKSLSSSKSTITIITSFDHLSMQNTRDCWVLFLKFFTTIYPYYNIHNVDPDWSITFWKRTCFTWKPHSINNFLSCHQLSLFFTSFVSSMSSILISTNVLEALEHHGWQQVMIDEIKTFDQNQTWELVSLASRNKTDGCRWVYAIKVGPNNQIDDLQAKLVANVYTHIYKVLIIVIHFKQSPHAWLVKFN